MIKLDPKSGYLEKGTNQSFFTGEKLIALGKFEEDS